MAAQADIPDSLVEDALAHHRAGRLAEAEAAYRAVLDRRPDHPGIWHNLGVVRAESGDPAGAVACFDRALAADSGYVSAHANRAAALWALDRPAEASEGYRRVVALEPDHYAAHRALGFLWQRLGRRDRALDHFARTLDLRRGDGRIGIAADSLRKTTRRKLLHDAAQFRHLAATDRPRQPFELHARACEAVAAGIGAAAGDGIVDLTAAQLDELGETYNTPLHVREAPELPGGAINPALDAAAITAAFRAGPAGIAWFDDLLTPAALARLRRYLLESTVWSDFTHIDGFVATYLEDGLASPLFLQIADEVRAAFPTLLGPLPLVQAWAFKGLEGDRGIDLHADDAAVSLNFWVTPDSANRDPRRGGLVVCRTPPPPDWRLSAYDDDAARIRAWLAEHDADAVVVPYRQNRAVLFDSRLFHGSDAPDFAPGYENHRINITMLFGARTNV